MVLLCRVEVLIHKDELHIIFMWLLRMDNSVAAITEPCKGEIMSHLKPSSP